MMENETEKVHSPLVQLLKGVADTHKDMHAAISSHATAHAETVAAKRASLAMKHAAKKLLETK